MDTPRISVIFLSADGGASLKKIIRKLSTLGAAREMEIVVAIGLESPLTLEIPPCFAGFRLVHAPVLEDFGKARGAAIRAASAPFIVLGEDHSFPIRDWPRALLAALEAGALAAGPQMLLANPASSVSWSDFILCYGDFLQPQRLEAADHIPWHNSAYRREALLSFGDQLDFLLQADSALQAAMLARGDRFAMTPDAATEHCDSSLLWPQLIALYWGNRLYGANRATLEKWQGTRRLFYATSWPAIAALRTWRAARITFSLRDSRLRYPTLLPLLVAGSVTAATGEVWGYLFGLGHNTLRRRAHYELYRARYVHPSEVSLLTE